jgi:septum formation protein
MLILASGSPRRKELLSIITAGFKIIPSDVPEVVPDGLALSETAEFLAVKKCLDVAKSFPEDTVIGCDTVVILHGEILGKPADSEDAARMLRLLSGETHSVYTGVCISAAGKTMSFSERTDVTFSEIPESLIEAYVKTKSPLDKAGAYGIQDDMVKLFTKKIDGNYDNVIGLPVSSLYKKLKSVQNGN